MSDPPERRDPVEVVREVIDGWNAGEHQAGLFWPDAEWDLSRWLFDVPGAWQAPEEAQARLQSLVGVWEEFACEVESLSLDCEQVLAIGNLRMRGRTSGVKVSGPFGAIFVVREGRIARLAIYPDPDEAVAAHGR